jgi:hypothetical protein
MISAQRTKPSGVDALNAPVINSLRDDITATNNMARSKTVTMIIGASNAAE